MAPQRCVPSEILLVDDNDDLRNLFAQVLRIEGYSVVEASDGQAALDLLQSSEANPSLILLDIMMPNMSGAEFLQHVGAQGIARGVPIVVISGVADTVPVAKVTRKLNKPVSVQMLLRIAREYC